MTAKIGGMIILPDGVLVEVKAKLTPRQVDVLKLKLRGYTAKEMGQELFISRRAVESHWNEVRETLNVTGLKELIEWAVKSGLIEYHI